MFNDFCVKFPIIKIVHIFDRNFHWYHCLTHWERWQSQGNEVGSSKVCHSRRAHDQFAREAKAESFQVFKIQYWVFNDQQNNTSPKGHLLAEVNVGENLETWSSGKSSSEKLWVLVESFFNNRMVRGTCKYCRFPGWYYSILISRLKTSNVSWDSVLSPRTLLRPRPWGPNFSFGFNGSFWPQ